MFHYGQSNTIRANAWVFTKSFVVTPASHFSGRPVRELQQLDVETLQPEMISEAYPKALRLDRDRVTRVDLDRPTWSGGGGRIGVDHARFHLTDDQSFTLMIQRRDVPEVVKALRGTYPGSVRDNRSA
ncbi:MAG: hypothetical protein ABW033_07580 [Acidimicrobiia bacterium]